MNDRDAVTRVVAGERECFAHLVNRYQGIVYAMALARVWDAEDARDVSQETFLRAFRSLRSLNEPAHFGAWLLQILRRVCIDFLRGKTRFQSILAAIPEVDMKMAIDSNEEIEARDTAEALWKAVDTLDATSATVLLLHYGQGMKIADIAQQEGLSESAVKMRLKRSRAILENRTAHLRGLVAAMPSPEFSAAVMAAVKTVPAVSAMVWSPLLLAALLMRWAFGRDLAPYRPHLSPPAYERARVRFWVGALFFPAYMFALMLCRHFEVSHIYAFVPFLAYPLLGTVFYFATEWSYGSRLSLAIFFAQLAIILALFLLPNPNPLLLIGLVFILTGAQVWVAPTGSPDRRDMPGGPFTHGEWVSRILDAPPSSSTTPVPRPVKQTRAWFALLHRHQLIGAPLRKQDGGFTAPLLLRSPMLTWLFWRRSSRLIVDRHGEARCTIVPKDYVALAEKLPSLPPRRVLEENLSKAFTTSHAAYEGHDASTVAPLGLHPLVPASALPAMNRSRRYVLPGLGILLTILALYEMATG